VRRKPVIAPVPRQERDAPAIHCRGRDQVGRLTERGIDIVLAGIIEQCVEAGATDHRDVCKCSHVCRA
jgi:hypothetical protein